MHRVTVPIDPWPRPGFRATDRRAMVLLLAFAAEDVLGTGQELQLDGIAPPAGRAALDVRRHNPEWFDGWRTGAFRTIAAQQLGDIDDLDRASYCYTIHVDVEDQPDLGYLQLAWALAIRLAQTGACLILDAPAATWRRGETVASLKPDRPFTIQREISVINETEPVRGFGYPIHTRGMTKFARPDLIAGVPADGIEDTGRILNHLGRMLAEGHVLVPGQRLRFDGRRTLRVTPYTPGGTVPDVALANNGLLLIDE